MGIDVFFYSIAISTRAIFFFRVIHERLFFNSLEYSNESRINSVSLPVHFRVKRY